MVGLIADQIVLACGGSQGPQAEAPAVKSYKVVESAGGSRSHQGP